jgi:bacillithiol system protein YtxJ
MMEEITTLEQMSALVEAKIPTIVFKYSPTCGISQVAQEVWEEFSKRPQEAVRLAQCDVIQARPAARGLADLVGVCHQSPQVLALKNGNCVAHTSHYSITPAWLETTVEKLHPNSATSDEAEGNPVQLQPVVQ